MTTTKGSWTSVLVALAIAGVLFGGAWYVALRSPSEPDARRAPTADEKLTARILDLEAKVELLEELATTRINGLERRLEALEAASDRRR